MKKNNNVERTLKQLEELRKMPQDELQRMLQRIEQKLINQGREIDRLEALPPTSQTGTQLYQLYNRHANRENRASNIRLVMKERDKVPQSTLILGNVAAAEGSA